MESKKERGRGKRVKNTRKKDKFLDEGQFGDIVGKKLKRETDRNLITELAVKSSQENMKRFFKDIKLADMECFITDEERHSCPVCNKNRKFYCADCLEASMFPEKVPKVDLPIRLTVIHHDSEKIKKSSAVPLRIYNKELIHVAHFPKDLLDDELNAEGTYVLYPHKDALTVKELKPEELNSIKKIVALDCTWFQTNSLISTVSKYPVKYVKLEDYETTFWRPQHHSKKCLATCEAIYYFFKEYDVAKNRLANETYEYDGKYDNLLFYYVMQFKAIERARAAAESKAAVKEDGKGKEEKVKEDGVKDEKIIEENGGDKAKDEEHKVPE